MGNQEMDHVIYFFFLKAKTELSKQKTTIGKQGRREKSEWTT